MIEFRLTLIDNENPDQVAAYRLSREEIMDKFALKYDPFSTDPIAQMRRRDERDKLVINIAILLARNIADFMNDRDGFNGQRRADTIASLEKPR